MVNYFDLVKQFGSPLYVYDHSVLSARCADMKRFAEELMQGLPSGISVSMHYSTKANSNPAILKEVQRSGLNVDCMSPFELEVDKKSEFTVDRMLYVCNNISADEMKLVHDSGVLICLDSISQIETWGKLFPGTDIMVRINPGSQGVGHSEKVVTSGKATKFGISEGNLPLLFEIAEKYNLHIIGTHQHLGSLFLDNKIPDYIDGVKAGLEIVKKYFKGIEIVDLGGGFGVPYLPDEKPLSLSHVANELIPILNDFVSSYPSIKEFKFEPGRYIPCESGKLVGTVTAIKHENDTYWICTDIGMGMLVRPSMYDSYHEIEVIPLVCNLSGSQITANFCGNVCESGDILGKKRLLNWLPKPDDLVVTSNAGAYGYSMSSNYTGRTRPAEVMLYPDGTYKPIRERETLDDLMRNIVW